MIVLLEKNIELYCIDIIRIFMIKYKLNFISYHSKLQMFDRFRLEDIQYICLQYIFTKNITGIQNSNILSILSIQSDVHSDI